MKSLKLTLAEKLRKCRDESGLTQPKVAELVGVSDFQSASRWERGKAVPEIPTLERLAKLYGKPVGYFVDSEAVESPPPPPTVDYLLKAMSEQQAELAALRAELERLKSQPMSRVAEPSVGYDASEVAALRAENEQLKAQQPQTPFERAQAEKRERERIELDMPEELHELAKRIDWRNPASMASVQALANVAPVRAIENKDSDKKGG